MLFLRNLIWNPNAESGSESTGIEIDEKIVWCFRCRGRFFGDVDAIKTVYEHIQSNACHSVFIVISQAHGDPVTVGSTQSAQTIGLFWVEASFRFWFRFDSKRCFVSMLISFLHGTPGHLVLINDQPHYHRAPSMNIKIKTRHNELLIYSNSVYTWRFTVLFRILPP